ncbi:Wzz/FepE/Etk N-terminal domain-containing protein [Saccharomonospora sp. NPDC006951]
MTTTDSGSAPVQLLDMQRLFVAIRRQRRLWLSAGLLGLLAGLALAVALPAPPTAATKLIVVHELDQPTDAGSLISTDATLLQTTRVAEEALKRLGSPERPEDFLETYGAVGLTNNVLELTVEGADDADAVRRAQALADAFIADHVQRMQGAADAEAQALRTQRDRAQAELAQVDSTIAEVTISGTEDGSASATQLETLYGQRADLASQVSDLTKRAQDAAIGTPDVAAGTQIVDAPRPVHTSLLLTGATNGGIGLALGLAAGLALAAVSSVARDRPVLRREVSAHLGASVIAQFAAPGLLRGRRSAKEYQRVAVVLASTIRSGPGPVSLLELGCPEVTGTLAQLVAEELAVEGRVTIIDDLPSGRELLGEPKPPVRVISSGELGTLPSGQWERRIGVGSVEPGAAWTELGGLGEETVLVVRAGHATTAWLHTVARQLADCEIPVIGIVLVDADPKDRSDGTLWNGLHTALRGRSTTRRRHDDPPTVTTAPVPAPSSGEPDPAHRGDLPTEQFSPVKPSNVEVS